MLSTISLILALTAMQCYQIDGNNFALSLPRRLRTSNSVEQSTANDMVSSFIDDEIKDIEEIESRERLTSIREMLEAAAEESFMSFNPTESPTSQPTCVHPSDSPSAAPSSSPVDAESDSPSTAPSDTPSDSPSDSPSTFPNVTPSDSPSDAPSTFPSEVPIPSPTSAPIIVPVVPAPTSAPIIVPVVPLPTSAPTIIPAALPTLQPISGVCPGITDEERVAQILAILDGVADPDDIRNNETPQGLATTWIIAEDEFYACPDYPKLVQRWTLAVMYYSTNGDAWFQCSANPNAVDLCGIQSPFEGEERFLSAVPECEWAGIECIDGCVTEVEFEQNNLIGTIPTEMGLLSKLTIWGMERGGLSSTIPTEIGKLTNLIFLDLDFNELTGSITSELLSLSSLTQLDLNDNLMTGSINGIGVYPNMTFLQLHGNAFTGTVPESVGNFSNLGAFTLHESYISGTMPASVCNLRPPAGFGGKLTSLIADCSEPNPNIVCDCCTDCRRATVVV